MILTKPRINIIIKSLSADEKSSRELAHDLGLTTGETVNLLMQMQENGAIESTVDSRTRILMWRLPATGDTISTVVERLNKQEAEISALKDALKEVSK